MNRDYKYYARIIKGRPLPCAFIDLDYLQENIRQIVRRAGTKKVRPGTKAIRSIEILRRIGASDRKFSGWMCYSAAEAVYLSRNGFDDLFLPYPVYQPQQLRDVCAEIKKGKLVTVTFDSAAHLAQYQSIAAQEHTVLPVCLDIDVASRFPFLHFGVRWSHVRTPDQVRALLRTVKECANVTLTGVIAYEAQIAGLPDRLPGHHLQNRVARVLKRISQRSITGLRREVVGIVAERGIELSFVNAGGTASLELTATDPCVTELTPGSGFFGPALFDHYAGLTLRPAAAYAIEVTRKAPGYLVGHGGGYNAPGVCDASRSPVPYLPEGIKLTAAEGAAEVQTPMTYAGPESIELGDPIFLRPSTAGILAEHFNELLLISNGATVGVATTYRGDGMCFV